MTQMEIEKAVTQMEHVTAAERSAGRLDEDKLQRLQAEFDEVGWCRLGSVVDAALLGRLEGALDRAAAEQLLAKGPEAWATTRSMGPLLPRMAPWVDAEVVANPIVEQIVVRLLGGGAFIRWHGSNTALPGPPSDPPLPAELRDGWAAGPGMQHLHMDGHGWSLGSESEAGSYGLPWPHQPFKIFVNIAVHDMLPENGSTQIWPGSNKVAASAAGMPCDVQKIDAARMEPIIEQRLAAAKTRPVQLVLPRGAAVIRDLRCWHRGMPNCEQLERTSHRGS